MAENSNSPNKTTDLSMSVPNTVVEAINNLFALKPETGKIYDNDVGKFILSAIQKAILAHTDSDIDFATKYEQLEKKFEEALSKLREHTKR